MSAPGGSRKRAPALAIDLLAALLVDARAEALIDADANVLALRRRGDGLGELSGRSTRNSRESPCPVAAEPPS